MFQRPGRPVGPDRPAPFPNDQAARAANNGALPPDLSLIIKARDGGPDYVYAILTGFKDAAGRREDEPGHELQRVFPRASDRDAAAADADGAVTYADGTKATMPQMAHDVVTFLAWAAEPNLDERHRDRASR